MRIIAVWLSLSPLLVASGPIEFNRDIRPILSDKCYTCHGPDSGKKLPLRLDSEAAAKADLGGGRHAIVDGHPEQSELVQRITAEKPAMRMPPVYSGLKLTDHDIATLKQWIAEGAPWQKHWSLIAPKRPDLPAVSDKRWPSNGIDYFILARLDQEGLKPSPEASKETLIRRVTLDLLGLPPTPAEVDAFLADHTPNAYEKVVDRLLRSPQYGERMAARWLDAARYADTNGYQYDGERFMWRWRDWVINAFNRNEPFNQFALEQIAGDLLPNATRDQIIATGFNRNHRANTEDGIVPEEYAVEYVADRVDTTSTVFLGTTLGCARCHNHKYDPFTQKEYYQVFAYFNNVPELGRAYKYGNSPPLVEAPTTNEQKQMADLDGKIASLRAALDRQSKTLAAAETRWEKSAPDTAWAPAAALDRAVNFTNLQGVNVHGTPPIEEGRAGKAARFDGQSWMEIPKAGAFDITDRWSVSLWLKADQQADGSIVSRMLDNPKGKGYGIHLDHGKLHVNITNVWADDAIRIETERNLSPNEWHHLAVTYSGSRMAEGVHVYVDGQLQPVKVLLDTLYRPFNNAGKAFPEPLRIATGWGAERRFHGLIGDVRVYSRVLNGDELEALTVGETAREIAAKPARDRSKAEQFALRSMFLESFAPEDVRSITASLQKLNLDREALERSFPTVMVMAERPKRRDTFLLVRGAYDKHGDKVEPNVPAVLPPLPKGAPDNRLGFAEWVVDPANPLMARVTMNRFWQMYFGTGIVKTVEDFGVQGEWPSHPELLDWLATEFVHSGWDIKAMQKLIVMSAAYRQSSKVTPDLLQRDPENRLIARGPRVRLAPEMVRDQALAASNLLVEKIGGPSVKPYQPAGLWKEVTMQGLDYIQDHGDNLYRRSLYTFWKRTSAPPEMMNFDAAGRESCVVRETRTNTPLQALNLMNDVTFLEAARFIGQRMMKEGGSDDAARVRYGFRLILARTPSPKELDILLDSLRFHRDKFATNPQEADKFLKEGESQTDASLNPRELASYSAIASLILNMDEAVTKE
ncbi:MAG TPA: DUF1553 domain-containing protein [Bryobacteraceae bacterium]|jgi:hypothetical protein